MQNIFGAFIGGYVNQFFANEALREAVLGAIAVVMVGTLVIHMWRTGPKIQQHMRERLTAVSSKSSRVAAVLGVFLFTFLMITREGMETALMLMQVKDPNLINGALLGLSAAIAFAFGWAKFGHLINVKRFFQVTGIFLLLFMVQVASIRSTSLPKRAYCQTASFFTRRLRSFHLTVFTANGFRRS